MLKKNKIKVHKSKQKCRLDSKFIVLMTLLLVGIICGIIFSLVINDEKDINAAEYIWNHIRNINNLGVNWCIKVIYENIKYVVLMMIIGIFTNLTILIPCILIYRGLLYGIATTFLIKELSMVGLKLVTFVYAPFTIIYILIYILFGKVTMDYISKKADVKSKMSEYIIKTIFILVVVITTSIIEINIVPGIIQTITT